MVSLLFECECSSHHAYRNEIISNTADKFCKRFFLKHRGLQRSLWKLRWWMAWGLSRPCQRGCNEVVQSVFRLWEGEVRGVSLQSVQFKDKRFGRGLYGSKKNKTKTLQHHKTKMSKRHGTKLRDFPKTGWQQMKSPWHCPFIFKSALCVLWGCQW